MYILHLHLQASVIDCATRDLMLNLLTTAM